MGRRKKNTNKNVLESKWLENDLSNSTMSTLSVSILDDYRKIPLYPILEDIINGRPLSLRKNNVNKPYQNCDEYLDTFFRLMREDFISVIRDNLNDVKKIQYSSSMQKLWYFKNVKIKNINKKSSVLYFQFDTPSRAQNIDYENSKQFKNGSLLLISKDLFTTYSLGIVTDTFKLNTGVVGVDVVDYNAVKQWSCIDLLEPSVFYEPYRYVMAVLQDMKETNFPMKDYIIYGLKDIYFPSYLTKNTVYNINGIQFDVLEHNQWPSAEVLQMDINQYEAFKGALTKEFAMIQGPPGTGKTYIGLEIVKVIIENMYKTKKLTNPIMVVCMTNHALDQFLEGIWKITRNISRFGYGTKSDILVKYIPKMKIGCKDTSTSIYLDAKQDVITSIQKENEHIYNVKKVDRNQGILDLSCLTKVLIDKGLNVWFKNSYDLLSWLFVDISNVDGINPIDFIKKKQLLESCFINSKNNQAKYKLYCITLNDIKLYCTKIQCQLNDVNQKCDQDDNDILKIKDLKLTFKIMKSVEFYMMKYLKFYKSVTSFKCNNQINRDLLEVRDRWLLYYDWVYLFITQENKCIESLKGNTLQCRRDMNKYKSIGYLKPVKNKYVIGMTTTAAARNRYLLKNLKCPIVIIEEAAEVLEPHIVASLTEYCKHLILIGDHMQLRPQTANHITGQKYQLDISLFERMVNNKIPNYVLAEQHRMRPEIAGLVAPAIYPNLRNHHSVFNRSHIKGVSMDVFCITHNNHEQKNQELSSYVNIIEAKFLVALASYLLNQGYFPEDITIMAMYNAQVLYISDLINSYPHERMKDIKVTSVDGYQGEENEIVLLSLVRSNNNKSVGFLKTNNRVCVALSRARLGFYIAGNLKLLANASKLWRSVNNYLCKINALGPKLLLKCQIHNKTLGNVSTDLDFKYLTGCKLKCNIKLSCGHLCNKVCHLEDINHIQVKCSYTCERKCLRNHKCHKMCYEECDTCEVFTSEIGECGHKIQGKCCDIDNVKCQIKVTEVLKCGHILEKKCHETLTCNQICNKCNLNCPFRHLCQKQCGVTCGSCTHLISVILDCGHVTKLPCFQKPDLIECSKCKAEMKHKCILQ